MKKALVIISILCFGCGQTTEKTNSDSVVDTSGKSISENNTNQKDETIFSDVHLIDTTFIDGSHVTFLRPDDARYASYIKIPKSGIESADNHFGESTTMAIDTIIHDKKFKGIQAIVSSKRYIVIRDCKTCPITIDRDTINYGVIISAKGKEIKFEQEIFPGEHYIQMIIDYFNLKK